MSWLRFLPLDMVMTQEDIDRMYRVYFRTHPPEGGMDWKLVLTFVLSVVGVLCVVAGITIVRLVRNKIQKQEIAEIQRNAQRESDKTEG